MNKPMDTRILRPEDDGTLRILIIALWSLIGDERLVLTPEKLEAFCECFGTPTGAGLSMEARPGGFSIEVVSKAALLAMIAPSGPPNS